MKKRATFLPFSPPKIGEEEINEVVDTLRSGWITTGPKTKRFEAEFAEYVGAPAALALSSCTAALHVALAALGVGPGDEVITTTMTFCATANVVEYVGAKLVLVDVEPDTLNMSPDKVEAAITDKTKAIIPVHYSGHPVDMDPIREMAAKRGISVLEDAAHGLTAKYKGQMIGSVGNPTAFSFYATKNLTTAEGGMLVGTPEFLEKARILSLHGLSKDAWKRYGKGGSWYYEVVTPGFKYNMTDIQASLGLCQLRKLESFQQRRREVVAAYNKAFSGVAAIQTPTCREDIDHCWHLYVMRLVPGTLKIDRNKFIEELIERNIGPSVHFIPIHLHPFYVEKYGLKPTDFPIAQSNFERVMSLPLNPGLTDEDVNDVIEAVLEIVEENS